MDQEYWDDEQKFNKRKERQEKNIDKYAKNQIKKTVKTSIETAAIGSLADAEEFLGELWGHGRDYNDLSDRERILRDRWLDMRESILARAANGVRLSMKAIDRVQIKSYEEKRNNIIIKNKDNRGDENGRY